MKKILKTLGAAVVVSSIMINSVQAIQLEDLVIKHRQFVVDETEGYTEYVIVNYGADTNKLMSYSDEIHFDKSVYDLEALKETDPDDVFPGFTDSDVNVFFVEEADEFYRVVFWFDKLDERENLKKADDMEVFLVEDDIDKIDYVLADTLSDSIAEKYKELELIDLIKEDLCFMLPEEYRK